MYVCLEHLHDYVKNSQKYSGLWNISSGVELVSELSLGFQHYRRQNSQSYLVEKAKRDMIRSETDEWASAHSFVSAFILPFKGVTLRKLTDVPASAMPLQQTTKDVQII